MLDRLRVSRLGGIGAALWGADHFYWFTAILAARGMQTATCRLIALCIASLGILPLGLLASPAGPQTSAGETATVVIAVSCFALSMLWLRAHWPSRAQSLLCVLVASVAIGVSVLIQTNPVVGLTGAANYAVLTAFVVSFHTPRLLAMVWSVGAVTLGVLIIHVGASDPALAVCAAGIIVLLNVFVAFACRAMLVLIQPDTHHGDIEQLTGLLHRDAFYQAVATLLASRSRSDDRYLVVVAVNIDSFSLLLGLSGASGGIRARVAVGQALRETVRHNASVAHVSDHDFLIADTFTTADASPLVERVRGAIAATPQRLTASIGVVCTPLPPLAAEPPDDVLDKLIAIANQAIEQARMAGGNQVRYVLRPTLDEEPDDNGDEPHPGNGRIA